MQVTGEIVNKSGSRVGVPACCLPLSPSFLLTATSLYSHSAFPSYLRIALTCCVAVQVVPRSQFKLFLRVPLAPIVPK